MWTIDLFVPSRGVKPLWHALSLFGVAVAATEIEGCDLWHVSADCDSPPDRAALTAAIAVAAASVGLAPPDIRIAELQPVDWLAENRRRFPPVEAGRYFICGASYDGAPPPGREVLLLDAGPAFGSGRHETTRGCLMALDRLARRGHDGGPAAGRAWRALDLGCGSGILAIAMARTWRRPVLALDIDPMAVATTRQNARQNGVEALVHAGLGGAEALRRRGGPFALIAANILAEPLRAMARPLAGALGRGGRLVLSGLLRDQEAGVLAIYRAQGLTLRDRIVLGDWPTLVLALAR